MINFLPRKKQTIEFLSHSIQSRGDGYYIIKLEDSENHFTWITIKEDLYNEFYYNQSNFNVLYENDFNYIDESYEIKKIGTFNKGLADADVEINFKDSTLPLPASTLKSPAIISRSGFVKTRFSHNLSIESFKALAEEVFNSPKEYEEIISNAGVDNIEDLNMITDIALHAIECVYDDLKIKEITASFDKEKYKQFISMKNSLLQYLDYVPEQIQAVYKRLYNQFTSSSQEKKKPANAEKKIDPKVIEKLNESIESQPGNCDG